MKSRKIKYADRRSVKACIEQLQAILDGLRAGTIDVQQGREDVHMKPGGMVEFELRLEQLARRETIKLEMNWRPEAMRAGEPVALDEDEGPISELPPAPAGVPFESAGFDSAAFDSVPLGAAGSEPFDATSFGSAPDAAVSSGPPPLPPSFPPRAGTEGHLPSGLTGPTAAYTLDRIAAAEYQRLYTAARSLGSDGEWHLDKDQLIVGLARAGVDALTQQELYSLASQADADGRSIMFSEQAIQALKQASRRNPKSAPGFDP
jgi:amphi-Trp domain-containing protein